MSAPKKSAGSLLGAGLGVVGFSALAGLLVTVMVAPALAVTGMTANNTLGIFESLPEYMVIGQQSQQNTIVAKNSDGSDFPIATVYAQNREELSLDEMSDNLKNAAIAGEDRRFYDHGGVDVPSVARAALGQATGTSSSGASTITMQLVRNIRVQDAFNETGVTDAQRVKDIAAATYPNLGRKLQEMKYAIGLEKKYSKQTILAAYLNIVGMGQNTYGVQAAAQEYFGTTADKVTIPQAASLIAIVQNPNKNGLFTATNYAANEKRRNVILESMLNEKYITQAQFTAAIATKVDANYVHLTKPTNGCLNATDGFQFICDYAVRTVENGEVTALGPDKATQLANWKKGGYKLYVSINPDLQKTALATVNQWAPSNETRFQLGAAAVTVQVGTGRILDMATNKGYSNIPGNTDTTKTSVNFAADFVHGGSSGFQPGSTYKPYTLLAFLAAGHGVNEVFDAGVRQLNQAAFKDSCPDANGGWGGNYTFRNDENEQGPYTVMKATAASVNSVFLQMGTEVDQCDTRNMAISLGVHRADGAADGSDLHTDPSCVIGGCKNNIAPITQAAAYAAIANQGVFCQPILIDSVIDPTGAVIAGQNANCGQSPLVTPDIANTAAYAMAGVMKGTAAASNPNDGTAYIGKTGTTDSAWHTWMVGSSTSAATAVWVGNIQGTQNLRNIYINKVQVAVLRHRIFKPIAQAIDKVIPGHAFPAPAASLLNGSPAYVPDGLVGGTPEAAQSAIQLAQLTYADGGQVDSDLPVGTVASVSPASGSQVPRGTVVTVYTSNGTAVAAPNVVGESYATGQSDFQTAGFTTISQACQVAPPGTLPGDPTLNKIVTQSPSATSVVKKSTPVVLTVKKLTCP